MAVELFDDGNRHERYVTPVRPFNPHPRKDRFRVENDDGELEAARIRTTHYVEVRDIRATLKTANVIDRE